MVLIQGEELMKESHMGGRIGAYGRSAVQSQLCHWSSGDLGQLSLSTQAKVGSTWGFVTCSFLLLIFLCGK